MKENKRSAQTLWQLFKATFLLSAFTFGGGFVIVSLMKKKFVEELKWLDESEMLDITAIAQSSPGPIPINASVILGIPDVRHPGFSDCDSGHRPSSNDYHFGTSPIFMYNSAVTRSSRLRCRLCVPVLRQSSLMWYGTSPEM